MRTVAALLLLALTPGINSCRHADVDASAGSESASATAPADPRIAVADAAPSAAEPIATVPPPEAPPSVATMPQHAPTRVDFNSDVKPILEARCQPCHFPGGVMYERRPFDRAETITALGTKLFTRIKDEDEQRIINEFLAQQGAASPDAGRN
jgi:hypothetical protein